MTRQHCPGCDRDIRTYFPTTSPVLHFQRHHLDPDVRPGDRDRCVNSGRPVQDAITTRLIGGDSCG